MSTAEIIAALEREANAQAAAHAADVAAFHRRERLRRMEILLRDFRDEAEARGDLGRLGGLGVSLGVVDDGHIVFRQGERMFDIIACETLSVVAGGVLVRPNPDCPVLDQRCYDEIMGLVFGWANMSSRQRLGRNG